MCIKYAHVERVIHYATFEEFGQNDRGVSFTFGENVVRKFACKHEIDLICRAH